MLPDAENVHVARMIEDDGAGIGDTLKKVDYLFVLQSEQDIMLVQIRYPSWPGCATTPCGSRACIYCASDFKSIETATRGRYVLEQVGAQEQSFKQGRMWKDVERPFKK